MIKISQIKKRHFVSFNHDLCDLDIQTFIRNSEIFFVRRNVIHFCLKYLLASDFFQLVVRKPKKFHYRGKFTVKNFLPMKFFVVSWKTTKRIVRKPNMLSFSLPIASACIFFRAKIKHTKINTYKIYQHSSINATLRNKKIPNAGSTDNFAIRFLRNTSSR